MALPSLVPDAAFLLGRVLFATVIAYLAIGNLLDLDASVGYAYSKGVPLAFLAVPLGSVGLVAGALAIMLGVFPILGGVAILAFLTPITIFMHDFWTMEGEARQNEQIHFLKNIGLIGIMLVLLGLPTTSWPLAVGIGL